MAAFTTFDEGADYLNLNGWPPVVYFLLSNRALFEASDNLRNGLGEIQGNGYRRVPQSRPVSLNGKVSFAPVAWQTSGSDWPRDVRSLLSVTTPDNAGSAICAWQLSQTRDLSVIGRSLTVTPVFHS